MKKITVRVYDDKKADKFAKICDKQGFSQNLVLEKFIEATVYNRRIDTGEWS